VAVALAANQQAHLEGKLAAEATAACRVALQVRVHRVRAVAPWAAEPVGVVAATAAGTQVMVAGGMGGMAMEAASLALAATAMGLAAAVLG